MYLHSPGLYTAVLFYSYFYLFGYVIGTILVLYFSSQLIRFQDQRHPLDVVCTAGLSGHDLC